MDVGNLSLLVLMDKRRTADVVPHLPGNHDEAEEHRTSGPHVLVVQELQVVAAQVQKSCHKGKEDDKCYGPRVIGWAEHTDLKIAYKCSSF